MSRTTPRGVEIDGLMRDPAFRRSVQDQIPAWGFVAQVGRVLTSQGVPRESHARVLAKHLGWTEAQAGVLLKDATGLTLEHAISIARALGFRLRLAMEP